MNAFAPLPFSASPMEPAPSVASMPHNLEAEQALGRRIERELGYDGTWVAAE